MSSLNPEDLQITSFETTAPAVGTEPVIDTQQIDCWSPFCAYSEQRTCPERCP